MSKAKEKNKVNDRLRAQFNGITKVEEKNDGITVDQMIEITKSKEFYKTLDDPETVEYLKNQSLELFKIQARSVIEFGKVFVRVFDKLGHMGSKYEGTYTKWLEANQIDRRTALRYRKRYELYSQVEEKNKFIISNLPIPYIEQIYKEENREKFIKIINNGISYDEVLKILKTDNIIENKSEKKEEIEVVDYSFKEYKNILKNIDEKAEMLKEKEKLEIKKYLDKINKILNK